MPFFEPLPPEPGFAAHERRWAPPAWDRPSEGTLPAVIAVDALVHQNDDVAIAVDHLSVYPNGFTIHMLILLNPHHTRDMGPMMRGGPNRFPRVGVRFADGRTGGQSGPTFRGRLDLNKDDQGIPTEPFVGMAGGMGGGSNGWRMGAWVFPLPPEGPLEIFIGLPAAGLDETSITLDGSAIRAAAERAIVIWV